MRILICNSKSWFRLNENTLSGLEIFEARRPEELNYNDIKILKPDVIFFIHWNWIVEENIYKEYQCVVFHTAPLPYGRGGSPIQNLILDGFKNAPVCAIKMTRELDSGPILMRYDISLAGSLGDIFVRVSVAINKMICMLMNTHIVPRAQIGAPHVFKRLTSKDNFIPGHLELAEVFDRIRMLDADDYPRAFITHGKLKFEFSSAEVSGDCLKVICEIKYAD